MKFGKSFISAIFFVLLVSATAVAVDNNEVYSEALKRGMQYYAESQYTTALEYFNAILAESEGSGYHGEALLWAAKSRIGSGAWSDAEASVERFLVEYPKHSGYREACYLKGRLLYIQREYESAIEVLQTFLLNFGESEFSPYAYYWIGESLLELGQIDYALRIFSFIVSTYPENDKSEAASYKLSLIELKQKEQELLKLLKWSHEESLRALEEFTRREKTYEEAIASFQLKIASIDSTDIKKQVAELSESVISLRKQVADKNSELEKLSSELLLLRATGSPAGSKSAADAGNALKRAMELVSMKQDALALKAYYLEKSAALKGKTE